MKKDIKSLNNEELAEWVRENSLPAFRAKQIFSWLHKSGVSDFSEMSNVSKELRNKLLKSSTYLHVKSKINMFLQLTAR